MTTTTSPNDISHFERLIDGIKIAMLTTVEADGTLRSRPMATLPTKFEGKLWFFTRADAPKVGEIKQHGQINVSYSSPQDNRFVSVSGQATLVVDREKIRELWKPLYRAWFPSGLDDPQIALLRVDAEKAEYWDAKSSVMIQLVGFVQAVVTGQAYQPGEHRQVDLGPTQHRP